MHETPVVSCTLSERRASRKILRPATVDTRSETGPICCGAHNAAHEGSLATLIRLQPMIVVVQELLSKERSRSSSMRQQQQQHETAAAAAARDSSSRLLCKDTDQVCGLLRGPIHETSDAAPATPINIVSGWSICSDYTVNI